MTTERCANCYFWDKQHKRLENNKTMASCLFDPPRVFMLQPGQVITARPQTPDTARCGKFKDRNTSDESV